MIDICTVVFEPELPVLQLQARSIDLYCQNIGINAIYVMVNDHSTVDPAWWGSMRDQVHIYSRSALGRDWHVNGWVSQQALKMLGAGISDNEWCMIMDAKTIVVRSMDLEQLAPQGRPATGWMPVYPVFEPSRQITNKLWNIELPAQLGPGGVPFLVQPEMVRSMLVDIYQRTGQSFADWFQAQGMLTEFVLYSGWLWYKEQGFGSRYQSQSKIFPVNVCHSEVSSFDRKFAAMQDPTTLTVSIHRDAWHQLNQDQRQRYLDFLQTKGIA